jgi:hypothetical protein
VEQPPGHLLYAPLRAVLRASCKADGDRERFTGSRGRQTRPDGGLECIKALSPQWPLF